jgi:hypothetical protein
MSRPAWGQAKATAPESPESQPPKEGIMKKSIFVTMTASAVIVSGMGFATPAVAETVAVPTMTSIPVVSVSARSVQYSKKLENCWAKAGKREQRARPRDPQSKCKGTVRVKQTAYAHAFCPAPWFLGGDAKGKAKLNNVVKVKAFSKSVASGIVKTWARTKIKMKKAKAAASARVDCLLKPGVTPPPPPPNPCPPGSIYDPATGTCAKDGSTTPLPPTDAPGPNPTPVPGPGGGGPSECYDPVTGLPVPPGTPGAWCAA